MGTSRAVLLLISVLMLACSLFYGCEVFCPSVGSSEDSRFPAGVTARPRPDAIDSLRTLLRNGPGNWDALLAKYYGKTYDSQLADMVVYFPKNDGVRLGLMKCGKPTQVLRGERDLWVLVFSDQNLNVKPDTSKKESKEFAFTVFKEAVGYYQEPTEQTIGGFLKALSGSVFGAAFSSTAQAGGTRDSSQLLSLDLLQNNGGDSLFAGSVKMNLALNTVNRIKVSPRSRMEIRSAICNVGNFEKSSLGGGLGVGGTFGPGGGTNDRANVYLFGHLYIERQELPLSQWTWGPVVGTNLAKVELLHDAVAGVRIGPGGGLGQTGIILGLNLQAVSVGDSSKREIRKGRFFIALDYKL